MTKSIQTILSPLLIITYVLGLRIVEFPAGRSRPWLSLLYILLLWLTYYYFLYSTATFYMNLYSLIHHICHWLNSSIIFLSIINGIYHDKKFRHCLKKLTIIDVTLEKLGTTINYQQLYTKTIWLVLGWIVTAILINCVHVLYVYYQHNLDIPRIICISMLINYCSHINVIDDLTITNS
ncbi:PREDICTED: uncharacterized protein LOC105562371 [Vollenhovia emeryi]|uniref:uncharacterized protein LOC105562371 n=1 Tax=Vollenhovia emeryi TaxID=411798 RepID=UPI0005F415D3|nr:PREDICTED: uncharacterized protein LOC105562371 [Vollenhovia emeryi]